MSGFFQVDRAPFTSSIWLNGTPEERCLWWWLLGNKDDEGVVRHRERSSRRSSRDSRSRTRTAGLATTTADGSRGRQTASSVS